MQSVAAVPHISQRAHSTRRPPHGGRRMERAIEERRGVATIECISERIAQHLARENCSDMRSDVHP
eukprot:3691271-Lingulodinium_polyedra.AAC.1